MQRPTSVSVFGIMNIIFSIMGILGVAYSIVMLFVPMYNPQTMPTTGPEAEFMKMLNNNTKSIMPFNIFIGVISSVLLLVSGIGLMMLKSWGRILSVIYSITAILFQFINGFLTQYYVLSPMYTEIAKMASKSGGAEAVQALQIISLTTTTAMIGGVCCGILYPVLQLIMMTRPAVVEAFERNQYQQNY